MSFSELILPAETVAFRDFRVRPATGGEQSTTAQRWRKSREAKDWGGAGMEMTLSPCPSVGSKVPTTELSTASRVLVISPQPSGLRVGKLLVSPALLPH